MPELPEVETMVRDLTRSVTGRRIISIHAPFPGSVKWPDFQQFESRVSDQQVVDIGRRGKYAFLRLSSADVLIIHRGMTGSLLRRTSNDPMESHVRVMFTLDDESQLRFNDPRKFGKIYVMDATGTERPLPWTKMGPEPLSAGYTAQNLHDSLRGRTAFIKPVLLNQEVVAGLGNIYVDEALFVSGIHPQRRTQTLQPEEIERLHGAIRAVLASAVRGRGTTFSSYMDIEGRAGLYGDELQVFRKTGVPCPRCDTPITRLVVGGRGTHVCPNCQKV